MSQQSESIAIDSSLAREIEDAVLFGRHEELAVLLVQVEDDEDFPADLRRDLESLRYFREHYGSVLTPGGGMERKKIALMDSAFGMELLNRLRQPADGAAIRRA